MSEIWKSAPKWANWLAQDEDGEWNWFQNKPETHSYFWMPKYLGEGWWETAREAGEVSRDWKSTLEPRP